MWKRLSKLFGSASVTIPDAHKLEEGVARKIDVGDPMAGGKQVIVCRVGGKVYGLDSRCPHDGGRIAPGPLAEGKYAVCPLHAYKFDPATGEAVGVVCPSATRYRVEEKDGSLHLYL